MSNQCFNLFNYRSFYLFPPFHTPLKPYFTTLRPAFPFHGNVIVIGRRSGNRTSSLPPPLAAESPSELVLVATKEHHDGSIVFQFGDASELVEDVEVVEEIESEADWESNGVKVLDGDQERQVVEKTIEGESVSDIGRLTEVADEITDADIDSDIAERETNVTSDLKDYHAESIERLSRISEEEVLSSQFEVEKKESLEGVESALDKPECNAQLDEDESLNPTISLLDNSLNIDKAADPNDMLSVNGDDESEDRLVSVNLESIQPSDLKVVDVKQPYIEDELLKVETEDASESNTKDSMPGATMHIPDAELTATANEDVNEELQDMNISGVTLTDEMLPSDPLGAESLDEISQLQYVDMEVPSTDAMDVKEWDMESELQQVSTNKRDENDVAYVMPVSFVEEEEPILEEDEIDPQPTPSELQPNTQVSDIEVHDTMAQNANDVILQTNDETEDPSVSVQLETMQVELMDVTQTDPQDELHKVEPEDTSTSDTKDLPPLATMNISDGKNVAYVIPVTSIEEAESIQEEEVSQPQSTPLELNPTMQVSDIELQDTTGQNLDDAGNEAMEEGLLDMNINEGTIIDEMTVSNSSGAEPTLDELSQLQSVDVKVEATMEVSNTEDMDVKDQSVEDELQQVSNDNRDEKNVAYVIPVTSIEEAEPIQEEEVSQPQSTPLELNPTMQVSDIELQDTVGQNLDDVILLVTDETEDPSESAKLETMQVSHSEVMDELLEVETEDARDIDAANSMCLETMHGSDVELMEAANEDVEEGLQDMDNSEGNLIDEMPPSNPSGAEPTLDEVSQLQFADVKLEATMEVSTARGMDIEDLTVEDELQQVSTDNRDENDVAYVMPAEPILKEEVIQPCLTPVELKPIMQISDIEVQDAEGKDLDDGISQVINEDAGDGYIKDVERLLHQLEAQLVQDEEENHVLGQCTEIDAVGSSILVEQGENGSQLEAERIGDKVSSIELVEASEETEMLLATEAEVEREEIYLTGYFLYSGAALLEHPVKALTGGDDAYFMASSKWLGVANGVSQWSFEGTDPGVYAQELMRTCEEIVLNNSNVPITNPVELLCKGVKETNMSGSSNILIANLDGQALHVANIGDTGFLIIRHGAVYKKSSPLLHEFHFALQVEDRDDPLQLVEEYIIELDEGDIVVSATDGLFDNLYEPEIAMVVTKSLQAGMKPEEVASVLATRAQQVGRSAYVRSPFSDAAQAAGYTGYTGGKQDNVAVIVSLVENRSNVLADIYS